jgi:1,4-alpha-glucan branching enzyme
VGETADQNNAEDELTVTNSAHQAANGSLQCIYHDVSLLTDADVHLFNEGTHYCLYEKLGAHPLKHDDVQGTYFAAWAPNARQVFLMGDFNQWNNRQFPLHPRGQSGIWEGFLPDPGVDACYKYHIVSHVGDYCVDKADPFAFRTETPPKTASVTFCHRVSWGP